MSKDLDSWEDIEDQLPAFTPTPQPSLLSTILPPTLDADFAPSSTPTTTSSPPPYGDFGSGDKQNEDKDEEPYFSLMVLINYTKLTQGKIKGDDEDEELISELEEEILKDFENQTEKLFNANIAFHTDSLHWEKDMDKIEALFPDDYISFLDYPITIPGKEVEEHVQTLWKWIKEPTDWECVNTLKCEYLPIANRGVLYKYEMAMAIKYLALEQHGMGKMALAMKMQEDAEGKTPPMNVLDQIIAMIFSRLTIYGSEEEHFKKLAEVHEKVRDGWVKEFGCLPPDLLWRGTRISH